ncbi:MULTISPECIES: hypothetical protein [unclassified Roseibium]|uniref:hypothetical protein n=1 Tax=unclassified Roseibium TaxID=2629323 RepID=UPI00273D450D|nr:MULTISPECIES: hypothetical protein [unclassified Roseibium]
MVEIFKNDSQGTATDLGTLAFASNPSPDVVSSINFWEFDDVNAFGTEDPVDYYRFDTYQLASVRATFTTSTVGDYANYLVVLPVQGVSKIEGDMMGVMTGGEHSSSIYEAQATSVVTQIYDYLINNSPDIDTSAATWSRDVFPDSEAVWHLTGETVIVQVYGYEYNGTTDQIIESGGLPGEVDFRLAITPHLGNIPSVEEVTDADNSPYEVYRFYNTLIGNHFYTTSIEERDNLISNNSAMNYEGNVFDSNATADNGGAAVYRFYNTATGTHFYTASADEAANIRANLPSMNDEGISYYAHTSADGGGVALYRFFNTQNGSHFFTTSESERDNIISTLGHLNYEGVAYYVDLA